MGQYEQLKTETIKLGEHMKRYATGMYPAYYLQLNTPWKINNILKMTLADIYTIDDSATLKVKEEGKGEPSILFTQEDRKNLAWYAFSRVPVRNVQKSMFADALCLNKQNQPLTLQVYRKTLERFSKELNLSQLYNTTYLKRLYGYFNIIEGRKTAGMLALEYQTSKSYVINNMLREFDCEILETTLLEIAGIESGGDTCKKN